MSILDQIAKANDIEEHEVTVPEWGVDLLLITPTMATRSRLLEAQIAARRDIPAADLDGLDEATANMRRIDMNAMQFAVIQACVFDPKSREAVFKPDHSEEDINMMGKKNGKVVWELFEACQKMAGLASDDKEEGPIEAAKGGS